MNKNHLLSTILTIVITMVILYCLDTFTKIEIPMATYFVSGALGLVSFIFGEWISKAINERPALYVNRYMMSFLLKMLGFIGFLAIFIYLNPENKVIVAISCFACYLIFTVHMIVFLKLAEKKNSPKNPLPKKSN